MSSIRHTIVSASFAAGLVLAAGSVMLSSTAPARLASAPAPVESKVATADTLLLLQALWERPELDAARRALGEELNGALSTRQAEVSASEAQLQQTLQSLQARYNALPDGDPERDQIIQAYQMQQELHSQRSEALQQLQAESEQRFDDQRADQLRECYATLKAAIATVAQREGYTHVISHATTQAQFDEFDFNGVLQGIRDRAVVYAPEGTDLTDLMLAHLGVSRPTFQNTPPEAPGASEPAGPAGPDAAEPNPPAAPPPGR